MTDFLLFIADKLSDRGNGILATLTGTILGYIPGVSGQNIDRTFQHAVWTLTIVIALLTIFGFVQKQIDRYKDRNKKKRK